MSSQRTLRSSQRSRMGFSEEERQWIASQFSTLSSKIDSIDSKLENRISVLEATVETQLTKIKDLESKIENAAVLANSVEQYTRRESVRIHGLSKQQTDSPAAITECVKDIHSKLGLQFDENKIERAHRVGAASDRGYSIIVKFKSFKDKAVLYKARPKPIDGVPNTAKFRIALDLTKSNYDLLKQARAKCDHIPAVKFVCADMNCSLVLRTTAGDMKYFKTIEHLNTILEKL